MVRPEDIPSGAVVHITGGPDGLRTRVLHEGSTVDRIARVHIDVRPHGPNQATLHYRTADPASPHPWPKQVQAEVDLEACAEFQPG